MFKLIDKQTSEVLAQTKTLEAAQKLAKTYKLKGYQLIILTQVDNHTIGIAA